MPGGAGSALINCHARQIGYRAALPAIRKLPAPSHCCIPAQHATTRPYLPCQRVPRRPGRSRCTRPQMPSDMCSLSNETFKDEASKTPAPPIRMDSNRSRGICQLHLAGTTQWSVLAVAISTGAIRHCRIRRCTSTARHPGFDCGGGGQGTYDYRLVARGYSTAFGWSLWGTYGGPTVSFATPLNEAAFSSAVCSSRETSWPAFSPVFAT